MNQLSLRNRWLFCLLLALHFDSVIRFAGRLRESYLNGTMKQSSNLLPFAGCARRLAPLFGIEPRHLNNAVRRGDLIPHRIGNRNLLIVADVLKYIERQPPLTRKPKMMEIPNGA